MGNDMVSVIKIHHGDGDGASMMLRMMDGEVKNVSKNILPKL